MYLSVVSEGILDGRVKVLASVIGGSFGEDGGVLLLHLANNPYGYPGGQDLVLGENG